MLQAIAYLTGLIFISIKLSGIISWAWWIVLLPFTIYYAYIVITSLSAKPARQ